MDTVDIFVTKRKDPKERDPHLKFPYGENFSEPIEVWVNDKLVFKTGEK